MKNIPPPPAYGPFITTRQPLSRRTFLKGAGIALSLPLLDSMVPVFSRASESSSPLAPGSTPRRMFTICNNLGLLERNFMPKGSGRDYVPSEYLQALQEHREDFTVITGISHPAVDGAHKSDGCFLTGAPQPGSGSFRNTISIDQFVAQKIGIATRFPSITLGVNSRRGMSYTDQGVAIPPEDQAAEVFKQLFLQGSPAQIESQVRKLDSGRSILDSLSEQTKKLQNKAGARDRDRLDQYFSSVRDLEHRMQVSRGWEYKPKPVVKAPVPVDPTSPAEFMGKVKVMYQLAQLAFETDSTRTIALFLDSAASPALDIPGATITEGYHNLSHHSSSPDRLGQLKAIELSHMRLLAKLYGDLKAVREGDGTVLDRTMVLYGSNFGDSNTHVTANLPTIFAGGGFKHGQHLEFDRTKNIPLSNLYVTMMHRMGIGVDKFSTSNGIVRGLEMT